MVIGRLTGEANPDMSSNAPRRVLLLQQRQWGAGIGHELAKRFQRDGCRLAAFTAKPSTDRFTREQRDVAYELILNHDALKDSVCTEAVSLDEICRAIDRDSIWPLVYSARNEVYSYAEKYYFAFRQNRTDEEIVNYVKAIYVAVRQALDSFQPEWVVMPNFVSLFQIVVGLMARKRGAKVVSFTDSKVFEATVPVTTPYLDEGPFIDRVRELNAGAHSANDARAAGYIAQFRRKFIQPEYTKNPFARPRTFDLLKRELIPYVQSLHFLMGRGRDNHVRSHGITIDYRPPRIILRDHYTAKRYRKAALSRAYTDVDALGEFVYFPLQVQPEAQIDMLAPNFANQIETARQIALALPGDYTLAVKEHPTMVSRRPPSYHDKLDRLPNVKLIDPRIPTQRLLHACGLVISPGGTTLAEAAFYGKPGIQLGWLGTSLMLPNVVRHTDMTTLSGTIRRLLEAGELTSGDYERRLRNYVAAVYDTGFEMNFGRVWYEGGSAADYDAIYRNIRQAIDAAQGRAETANRAASA